MASDRARNTYDETRRYRSVVMQQGRVLLEADWNEAAEIDRTELRHETLDIVGPAGTPDDGYRVDIADAAARTFTYTGGTMYVGGVRAFLPKRLRSGYPYDPQLDWLQPVPRQAEVGTDVARELIYLELFEQEISAVEDPPLLDPALGGPDTAQRLRIVQRVHRVPVRGSNCETAWDEQKKRWEEEGLHFDDSSMMLLSRSRLRVSFSGDDSDENPCDPAAEAGYLGADNQMIRVAIAKNAADGTNCVVWGFDDASAIYRVTEYDGTPAVLTLTLANRPVDDEHKPRVTQVIELLRGMAVLDSGVIAAEPFGPIVALAGDYSSTSKKVKLAAALPAGFEPTDERPLYVRVWETPLPATANTPLTLGTTGIQVTIDASVFHQGDFWTFAVRPSTRSTVLPERYQHALQPPEGFRTWVCPLAVIDWTTGRRDDCREVFDNLVELTKRRGSCCVVVRPSDLERRSLQDIIDHFATSEHPITFCLTAGRYPLRAPLIIRPSHGPITIEGCGPEVRIVPRPREQRAFAEGLIHLLDGAQVTLTDLHIFIPSVPLTARMRTSIGVRAMAPHACRIERCTFDFSDEPDDSSGRTEVNQSFETIGAAALTNGRVAQMELRGNVIAGERGRPSQRFGFVFTPAVIADANEAHVVLSAMERVVIEHNEFRDLHAAVFAWSELGEISIRENTIMRCSFGIILLATRWFAALAFLTPDRIRKVLADHTSATAGRTSGFAAWTHATYAMLHPSLLIPGGFFASLAPPFETKPAFDLDVPAKGATLLVNELLTKAALGTELAMPGPLTDANAGDKLRQLMEEWQGAEELTSIVPKAAAAIDLAKVFAAEPVLHPVIDCSHNDVTQPFLRGSALIVITDERSSISRVIVSESNFESAAVFWPTALLLFVRRCTVTGNLIQNDDRETDDALRVPSLILAPTPHSLGSATVGTAVVRTPLYAVAVTGNVFVGIPHLPVRPAPFPQWLLLNTEVAP